MEKKYVAPKMEIEMYELNTAIASNCAVVVNNGPEMGSHQQCADYKDPFGVMTLNEGTYNVQFYEDTNCDCYYSASDTGYWTS